MDTCVVCVCVSVYAYLYTWYMWHWARGRPVAWQGAPPKPVQPAASHTVVRRRSLSLRTDLFLVTCLWEAHAPFIHVCCVGLFVEYFLRMILGLLIICGHVLCHQATGTNEPHQFITAGDGGHKARPCFPTGSPLQDPSSLLSGEDVHSNELQIQGWADISQHLS